MLEIGLREGERVRTWLKAFLNRTMEDRFMQTSMFSLLPLKIVPHAVVSTVSF